MDSREVGVAKDWRRAKSHLFSSPFHALLLHARLLFNPLLHLYHMLFFVQL
jgi:hypothetical protein